MAQRVWKTRLVPCEEPITFSEYEIEQMNATEIIDLLNRSSVRVDRLRGREELSGMLRRCGAGDTVLATNNIDPWRVRVNELLSLQGSSAQIPPECPADCFQHPDLLVIHCAHVNKDPLRALVRRNRRRNMRKVGP